jgi:hypothetical protein
MTTAHVTSAQVTSPEARRDRQAKELEGIHDHVMRQFPATIDLCQDTAET